MDENVTYHKDLVLLAESLGLKTVTAKNIISALKINTETEVVFLLSVPSQLKAMLLDTAKLLVYTPSNEHFGIVPLEAMLAGVPVLATNSGGPLETVLDGETGWLRPVDNLGQWTEVMHKVLFEMPNKNWVRMGEKGTKRVKDEFSRTKMASRLNEEIENLMDSSRRSTNKIADILVVLAVFGGVLMAVVAVMKSS